jgi:hypothetical protein
MMENTIPTYADFVRKLFNRSGDPSKDFTHAILGIVTEIHEYQHSVDDVNGVEELGDIAFYLVALRQVIEDHTGVALTTVEPVAQMLSAQVGLYEYFDSEVNYLQDVAKRWVGYGKAPTHFRELFNRAVLLTALVNGDGEYPCEDLEKIQTTNMRKLLKRYPGGEFSQYHALVRDLDAEREALAADQ